MQLRRLWPALVALAVAAGVMAAGISLFQHLPRLFPKASGQEMLAQWVEENTGATLSAGYIVPLFYPGIGFQIRDLELRIPDGKGESTLFAARSVKVVADRTELLDHKKIKVRQIILDRPRVYLSRDGAGRWNVSVWLKNRKKKEPPDPEKMGFWRWLVYDSLKEVIPTADTDLPRLLSGGRLRVIGAEIRVVDGKRKLLKPIHLTRINLEVDGGLPARVSLKVPFPQNEGQGGDLLSISGAVRAKSNHALDVSSLKVDWPGLAIHSLSGSVNFKPLAFDARIDTTCSYPAFKRIAMWGPIARSGTIPDTEGSGTGHIKAHVWGLDRSRVSRVHYEGTVTLKDFTFDPGRVIAPIEDVNATAELKDGEVWLPETTVKIGGMPVTGSMRMIEARDPIFIIDAHADAIDFGRLFKKSRHQDPPGTPMGRMRTQWEGSARLNKAIYGKMVAEEVKGKWKVTNQRLLTFPELTFRACGGSYVESGRTYVDYNHRDEIYMRIDGRAHDVDITAFTDQIFNTTTFLHGRFNTQGYITGTFVKGKLDNRSLNGHLPVKIRDGYFAGYNFVGEVFKVFGASVPEEYQGQHFNRMTATVELKRAVAVFNDLSAEAFGLKAAAQGWIDFPGHTTDIKIEAQLLKPVWGLIKAVPLVGVITGPVGEAVTTLYIRVSGRWDKLQYSAFNPLDQSSPPPPPSLEMGGTESPPATPEVAPGETVSPKTGPRKNRPH